MSTTNQFHLLATIKVSVWSFIKSMHHNDMATATNSPMFFHQYLKDVITNVFLPMQSTVDFAKVFFCQYFALYGLYYSNINEKQTQKCSHILFSEHLFSKIFLRNSPSKNMHGCIFHVQAKSGFQLMRGDGRFSKDGHICCW